jgi:hypothetical protein
MGNLDPRNYYSALRQGLHSICDKGYEYFGDSFSGFYVHTSLVTRHNVGRLLREIAVRGEDRAVITTNLQAHQNDPAVAPFLADGRIRMLSFENWNYSFPSKLSLVQAGFVYSGSGDNTYTYCCKKVVGNWIPGMMPTEIHRAIGNGCEMANHIYRYREKISSTDPRILWEEAESMPQNIEMNIHLKGPYDVRHNSLKSRFRSFINWPAIDIVKPMELAQAGFYYEGKVDFVRCFYCNGGLMDWTEGDNPFIRHAQVYNECSYLRAIKGEQFLLQSLKFPSSLTLFIPNEEYVPPELQCKYCCSRLIRIVLSPCGHLGGCGACAHKHKDCPICRQEVMGRYPINF